MFTAWIRSLSFCCAAQQFRIPFSSSAMPIDVGRHVASERHCSKKCTTCQKCAWRVFVHKAVPTLLCCVAQAPGDAPQQRSPPRCTGTGQLACPTGEISLNCHQMYLELCMAATKHFFGLVHATSQSHARRSTTLKVICISTSHDAASTLRAGLGRSLHPPPPHQRQKVHHAIPGESNTCITCIFAAKQHTPSWAQAQPHPDPASASPQTCVWRELGRHMSMQRGGLNRHTASCITGTVAARWQDHVRRQTNKKRSMCTAIQNTGRM